jgi:uncharacterized protein YcfJ
MKRVALASLALAISVAAGAAQADNGYGYNDQYRGGSYQTDYESTDVAQVESVDPIVDRSQPRQRQECWNEPVSYRSNDDRYYRTNDRGYNGNDRRNIGAGVIGGIIGGALGNQVGKGDGKKAATIAGAVVGYQIGKGVANRDDRRNGNSSNVYRDDDRYNDYRNETVQRCRTVIDGYEERVIGYNVTYRYAGRTYRTVTDTHPGRTIQVRVAVQPVKESNLASRY